MEIDGSQGADAPWRLSHITRHPETPDGPNVEFTAPKEPGTYRFSCSMGHRGQIVVVP